MPNTFPQCHYGQARAFHYVQNVLSTRGEERLTIQIHIYTHNQNPTNCAHTTGLQSLDSHVNCRTLLQVEGNFEPVNQIKDINGETLLQVEASDT